jgi:NRAMP (natural resistance-associated macrophage protein)-like metal ion transporter
MGSLADVEYPSLRRALQRLGPTFVVGAAIIGPGSVTLSSIAGSQFGYGLLWVLALSGLFAVVYVEMGARFGIVSERTFLGTVQHRYGRGVAVAVSILLGAVILGASTGNILGASIALEVLTGVDPVIWGTVVAAVTVAFVWLRDIYQRLEVVVLLLVGVMLVSFVGTATLTGFSPSRAATGLVPSVPSQAALVIAVAIVASYFNLATPIVQSYLVREKGYDRTDLGTAAYDSVAGYAVVGLLLVAILVVAAEVLGPQGVVVDSAAAMARQLEPLVGSNASLLFGLGLLGASLSSVVATSLTGAVTVADGLGYEWRMDCRPTKAIATAAVTGAWALSIGAQLLGRNPVDTLVLAQVSLVVGTPVFGALLLVVLNDEDAVAGFTNTLPRNVLAVLGYLLGLGVVVALLSSFL